MKILCFGEEKMIKFNPIKNKFPKGAINNIESFHFEVLIKDDFYFNDFKIIIKNEFTGDIISKSLKIIIPNIS